MTSFVTSPVKLRLDLFFNRDKIHFFVIVSGENLLLKSTWGPLISIISDMPDSWCNRYVSLREKSGVSQFVLRLLSYTLSDFNEDFSRCMENDC